MSDRIAIACNRSGATHVVALDVTKAFNWVSHTGLLTNLSLIEFQIRYLALFCLFWVIDNFE